MELLQNASNDQIALMGCVGTLLLCGGLMTLTGHFNKSVQAARKKNEADISHLSLKTRQPTSASESTKREAA